MALSLPRSPRFSRSSRRALPGPAVLAAGLLAGLLLGASAPQAAHAALSSSTDPIVNLSNGVQVQITAALATSSSAVSTIAYTLHVPTGARVTKITYTGGGFTGKETVTVYADDAAHSYDTATLVTLSTSSGVAHGSVAVSAKTAAQGAGGNVSTVATGVDGQSVGAHVTL